MRIRTVRRALVLLFLALAAVPHTPAAAAPFPLGSGPEIAIRPPETREVARPITGPLYIEGSEHDLLVFRAEEEPPEWPLRVAILRDGELLSERLLDVRTDLRTFAPIAGAETGSGFLLLLGGDRFRDRQPPLVALELDRDGNPMGEPREIWETGDPGVLTGGPDRFLFVWERGSSVRTLTLDAHGKPLDWSAPIEELAGTVSEFDVAATPDGYHLAVNGNLVCLDRNGQRLGTPIPLFAGGADTEVAARDGETFVTWVAADRTLRLARVSDCSAVSPIQTLLSDWDAFTHRLIAGENLRILALPRDGSVVRITTATREGEVLEDAEIDVGGNVRFEPVFWNGSEFFLIRTDGRWVVGNDAGGVWEIHLADRLVDLGITQTIEGVAATADSLLISWSDEDGARETLLTGESLSELTLPGSVAAADGDRYLMLLAREGSEGPAVDGRFFDPDSGLTEEFLVSPPRRYSIGIEGTVWTGTSFLVFRAPALPHRLSLFPGLIWIASVLPNGSSSEALLDAQRGTLLDAACAEGRCFAAWNSWDWRDWDAFGPPFSSFLAAAPVGASGAPPDGEDIVNLRPNVDDAAVAPVGTGWGVFSIADGALHYDFVSESSVPLASEPVQNDVPEAAVAAIGLGEHALVVWETAGDLVGRFAAAGGWLGQSFPLAATADAERRPHLVRMGERTFLVYERLAAESAGAPRIFARELLPRERRRTVGRDSG